MLKMHQHIRAYSHTQTLTRTHPPTVNLTLTHPLTLAHAHQSRCACLRCACFAVCVFAVCVFAVCAFALCVFAQRYLRHSAVIQTHVCHTLSLTPVV